MSKLIFLALFVSLPALANNQCPDIHGVYMSANGDLVMVAKNQVVGDLRSYALSDEPEPTFVLADGNPQELLDPETQEKVIVQATCADGTSVTMTVASSEDVTVRLTWINENEIDFYAELVGQLPMPLVRQYRLFKQQ